MNTTNPTLQEHLNSNRFPYTFLKEIVGEKYMFYLLKATEKAKQFCGGEEEGKIVIYWSHKWTEGNFKIMIHQPFPLLENCYSNVALDLLKSVDYETFLLIQQNI